LLKTCILNLITGATGIIGSHVALALLRRGLPVTATRQSGSDVSKTRKLFSYYGASELFEQIKWTEIDITNNFSVEDALEENATVFHCAGMVSFNRKDRKKLFEVNEIGTKNLVNACLHKKTKALCHVSSVAVFHNKDFKAPLDESVFWKKSGSESDYAKSKYNAEKEVWRGIEEGLNAVIINPGVVLSPGFWDQSSSKIFNTCYKGNRFYTNGTTGYVAASDVATIMLELVLKERFGQRYILVENNYSFRTIFNQIQTNFGRSVPSIKVSRTVLTLGWIANFFHSSLTGKTPTITKAVINSALNNQSYSNQKILDALSYKFTPIEEVIGQICEMFLKDKSTTGSTGSKQT
jgi:dihydroflavonol-4-reductase